MPGYLLHPVFAFGSLPKVPKDDVIKITKSLTSVIVTYFSTVSSLSDEFAKKS